MKKRTKVAFEIFQTAILVGFLGNILLRVIPWGINVFLFVTAFTFAMVMLGYRHRPELFNTRRFLLHGAMVFFAGMFALRSSEQLLVFDTIAILVIMGILILPNLGLKPHISGVLHYAAGFVLSGVSSLLSPFMLLGADIDWKSSKGNGFSTRLFSIFRGLAAALPLMLVFGGLFAAADENFERMLDNLFSSWPDTLLTHIALTTIFAWLTAGYFRGTLMRHFSSIRTASISISPIPPIPKDLNSDLIDPPDAKSPGIPQESFVGKFAAEPGENGNTLPNNATAFEHLSKSDPPDSEDSEPVITDEKPASEAQKFDWQHLENSFLPAGFTLGATETIVILGLIDLLFISFVVMQLPYLFGGMEIVQNTPDFKLAAYARRGFGELVAVSALVLPMLLAAHWLLRRDNAVNLKVFRLLAGIQVALVFVIMASAAERLLLLTGNLGYGMTDIRFYPLVFMVWLVLVFAWFCLTVLREERSRFAWGALWSALLVLAATNIFNPDDFIARTNLSLMKQGREFDAYYNSRLSEDAIPALVEGLPLMTTDDGCIVRTELKERYRKSGERTDFRSWNYAGLAASRSLQKIDDIHDLYPCFDKRGL